MALNEIWNKFSEETKNKFEVPMRFRIIENINSIELNEEDECLILSNKDNSGELLTYEEISIYDNTNLKIVIDNENNCIYELTNYYQYTFSIMVYKCTEEVINSDIITRYQLTGKFTK